MSDSPQVYGQFDEAGAVKVEPMVSIYSGLPLHGLAGTVRERVPGTLYFYRLRAAEVSAVTEAQRAEWRAGAPGAASPGRLVRRDAAKPSEE